MIEDRTARTIAHHFRGGPDTGLFAFYLVGQIVDPLELLHEINEDAVGLPPDSPAAGLLQELAEYVIKVGEQSDRRGWSHLWDPETDRALQGFAS